MPMAFKRLLIVIVLALLFPAALYAQASPPQVNAALEALSARVGRTLTVGDLDRWQWSQSVYPDASLGCPQEGQLYAQVVTSGYQFLLTYQGITYDYRVAENLSAVILCNESTVPQTTPDCPPPNEAGWLAPRLRVGETARVRADGIPNNVRSGPGRGNELLGELPPATEFIVREGPFCNPLERLIWWRVEASTPALSGWTAEGQGTDYWLEPLDLSGIPVAPSATPTSAPAPVPASGFTSIDLESAASLSLFASLIGTSGTVAVAPDGLRLAIVTPEGRFRLVTLPSGSESLDLSGHSAAVTGVAFSPAGDALAVAAADGRLLLYGLGFPASLADSTLIEAHSEAITALAFSPEAANAILATGSASGSVKVWSSVDGRLLLDLGAGTAPVKSLHFSANGITLLAIHENGDVRAWMVGSAG